jgi:hypothetical protein
MKKMTFIALFCCLLYSAGAQKKFAFGLDTVPIWGFVVDTSHALNANYPVGRPGRFMHLLEVREWHNTRELNPYWGDCMNCEWQNYPKHITYLLRSRMKLPFSWAVFRLDGVQDAEPQMVIEAPPAAPDTASTWRWGRDKLSEPIFHTIGAGDTVVMAGTVLTAPIGTGYTTTILPDSQYIARMIWETMQMRMKPDAGLYMSAGSNISYGFLYQWLPRRLRRRFMKYNHLGKWEYKR